MSEIIKESTCISPGVHQIITTKEIQHFHKLTWWFRGRSLEFHTNYRSTAFYSFIYSIHVIVSYKYLVNLYVWTWGVWISYYLNFWWVWISLMWGEWISFEELRVFVKSMNMIWCRWSGIIQFNVSVSEYVKFYVQRSCYVKFGEYKYRYVKVS